MKSENDFYGFILMSIKHINPPILITIMQIIIFIIII